MRDQHVDRRGTDRRLGKESRGPPHPPRARPPAPPPGRPPPPPARHALGQRGRPPSAPPGNESRRAGETILGLPPDVLFTQSGNPQVNLEPELLQALGRASVAHGPDPDSWSESILWLQDWQTLAGALLALLAALLHAWMVQRQIRSGERLAAEHRKRRAEACRAALPLSLAAIGRYCEEWAPILSDCYKTLRTQADSIPTATSTVPRLPSEVVTELRHLIEHSDSHPSRAAVSLLSHLQIVDSRLKTLVLGRHSFRTRHHVFTLWHATDAILHLAALHAETSELFNYARFGTLTTVTSCKTSCDDETIRSSAVLLGFNEIDHPDVFNSKFRPCWHP